jgi:hypothetical protein
MTDTTNFDKDIPQVKWERWHADLIAELGRPNPVFYPSKVMTVAELRAAYPPPSRWHRLKWWVRDLVDTARYNLADWIRP